MEVDGARVEDRSQHREVFAQSVDGVGPRRAERLLLGFVRAQSEAEAEVPVRRGLRRLGQRRHDQRVPWVDRHDGRADAKAGHGGADQSGQGDGVVVELLGQPDLADAEREAPGAPDR